MPRTTRQKANFAIAGVKAKKAQANKSTQDKAAEAITGVQVADKKKQEATAFAQGEKTRIAESRKQFKSDPGGKEGTTNISATDRKSALATPAPAKKAEGQKTEVDTLNDKLNDERAAKNQALADVKSVTKGAAKGLEEFKVQTRQDFAKLAESLGERFKELQSVLGEFEGAKENVQFNDPEFQQRAKDIAALDSPEDRKKQFQELVNDFKVEKPAEEAVTPPSTPQSTAPEAEQVGLSTVDEVKATNAVKAAEEVSVTAVSSPLDVDLNGLSFDSLDDNSASLLKTQLQAAADELPALLLQQGVDQQITNALVGNVNRRIKQLEVREANIKEEAQRRIDILTVIKKEAKGNVEENFKLIGGQYDTEIKRNAENRRVSLDGIEEERDRAEGIIKAQVALGRMPGGTFYANKLTTLGQNYVEQVRQTNFGFNENIEKLLQGQTKAMLDFGKQVNNIEAEYTFAGFKVIDQFRAEQDKINDDQTLLQNEAIRLKAENLDSMKSALLGLASTGRDKIKQGEQDARDIVNARQKAVYEASGNVFIEAGGQVQLVTDETGNPIMNAERFKESIEFFDDMSVPKKGDLLNIWSAKLKAGAALRRDQGIISESAYNNIVNFADKVKESESASAFETAYSQEGYRDDQISPVSAATLEQFFSDPQSVPLDIRNNCVKFLRKVLPDLPAGLTTNPDGTTKTGLWDLQSKLDIINNPNPDNPQIGSAAIIDAGEYGHVAFVESVNDDGTVTIAEANFVHTDTANAEIGKRTGTPEELGIKGYWKNPKSDPDVQKEITFTEDLADRYYNGEVSRTDLEAQGYDEAQIRNLNEMGFNRSRSSVLSSSQLLQAKSLSVDIFGKRAGTKRENVKLVEDLMADGKDPDDIQDELRKSGFGTEFTGRVKSAFNNIVVKGFTKEQKDANREALEESITEFGAKSNETKELMLNMALSRVPADTQKRAFGRVEALTNLSSIQGQLENYVEQGGDVGFFTGNIESLQNKIGQTQDLKLANLQNQIRLALVAYRSSVSGAAFSESEAKEYDRIFPSIDKNISLSIAKLDSLNSVFERNTNTFYRQQVGATNFREYFGDDVMSVVMGRPEIDTEFNGNSAQQAFQYLEANGESTTKANVEYLLSL